MTATEVRFAVRLTPKGGADRVDGVVEGVLRVRVAAAPVDGAANTSLVRLLADELGVGKRDVRRVAGAGGRSKVVAVDGIAAGRILERWPGLAL
jgi:uncharacterized protein YggU (UPF0235/DUF167 family)